MKFVLSILLFCSLFNVLKADDNAKFIANKLLQRDAMIKHGKFVNGTLYVDSDTLKLQILQFARKDRDCAYLFCITKIDGVLKIYRASEIFGYEIDDEKYIKHVSEGYHFFIRELKFGKRACLYERQAIPTDCRELYFIKNVNLKKNGKNKFRTIIKCRSSFRTLKTKMES